MGVVQLKEGVLDGFFLDEENNFGSEKGFYDERKN